MKLKGLVWFFTIALIIISIWELSYTWVIKSYESDVKAQAEKFVKRQSGYKDLSSDEKEALIKAKTSRSHLSG
jgi:SecD/SecF fusion protein